MIELRLIDVLPLVDDLPASGREQIGALLDVPPEMVSSARGHTIAAHETGISRVVATECLGLARLNARSVLLMSPLRTLLPLSAYVCVGTDDVREQIPASTFREMLSLAGIDDALRRVIRDVLGFATDGTEALRGIRPAERVCVASVAATVVSHARRPLRDLDGPIGLLAAWGRWEEGLEWFSQLGDAVSRENCPPEIHAAWERVVGAELASLGADRRQTFDPRASLERVVAGLDDREQRILMLRTWSLAPGPTLEALGVEMGITRERVRQLEHLALRSVETALHRPENGAAMRAAERLRRLVGAAAPLARLNGTPAEAAIDVDASPATHLAALLLLDRAGPYKLWGEWLVLQPAKKILAASVGALDALFETGYPLVDEALGALQQIGVAQHAVRDWLALLPRVRVMDDYVVPWRGTLSDKAEVALRAAGGPLTLDDIVAAIGEEFSIRTLRNYLSSDARFRRLGLREYGLDEWGGEEYTKISDEIAQEIERRGGEAPLEHLVDALTAQFGVAPGSVIAYAKGPQFDRTDAGMIRVRTSQARVPTSPIEFTRRCFCLHGQWSYRITVTDETLRGSGCSVPRGFVGYIGLAHGGALDFEATEMTLRFTWPSLLPCLGSLRPAVDALDANEGDYLFLAVTPVEGTASITKVGKHELDMAVGPEDRLLLEVGVTTPGGATVAEVATALGLGADDVSWAAIRRRLRSRGEEDLLTFAPMDGSADGNGLADLVALVGV